MSTENPQTKKPNSDGKDMSSLLNNLVERLNAQEATLRSLKKVMQEDIDLQYFQSTSRLPNRYNKATEEENNIPQQPGLANKKPRPRKQP